MRIPDPFDGSVQTRLIRMGVLDKDGQIDNKKMSAFAEIFASLFFDDLCDFYDDMKNLMTVSKAFRELYAKRDYQHMYLLILIQYDYIRKPLPDPIWWLAGDNTVVQAFITLAQLQLQRDAVANDDWGGDFDVVVLAGNILYNIVSDMDYAKAQEFLIQKAASSLVPGGYVFIEYQP